MNEAANQFEKAIHAAHRPDSGTVTAWAVIAVSVAYVAIRFAPWAAAGFPVVGHTSPPPLFFGPALSQNRHDLETIP